MDHTRCHICKRLLDRADDPLSENCGGDCYACIIDAEDGSPAPELPREELLLWLSEREARVCALWNDARRDAELEGMTHPDNPLVTLDGGTPKARPPAMRDIADDHARCAARTEAANSMEMTRATTEAELAPFLFGDAAHLPLLELEYVKAEQQFSIAAEHTVAGTVANDDLRIAHTRFLNNRSVVEAGGPCGCFYCLAMFDASQVVEWVDASEATALCPHCHIDTVLSSRTDPISAGFLRRMHDYWFEQDLRPETVPPDVSWASRSCGRRRWTPSSVAPTRSHPRQAEQLTRVIQARP